jgi:hypothetical protein
VAAVAERHARLALDGWSRHRGAWRLTVIALAGLLGGTVGWDSSEGGHGGTASSALTAVLAPLLLVMIVGRLVRVRSLSRMELANRLALLPAIGETAGDICGESIIREPGPASLVRRELIVRYDRGRVLRILGILFGIACAEQAVALWLSSSAAAMVLFESFSVLMFVVAVMLAVRVLRWGLPGRPVLELNSGGLHLPRYGYTLPWTELAEVRLIPLRSLRRGRGRPTVITAFMPADPGAALGDLLAKGAGRRLEKVSRLYGTPLAFGDQLTDQTADQVVAAVSTFTAVPVRRY